jgi:hypothetical protein
MTEPFETLEEVLTAALQFEELRSCIELDIINGDAPTRKDVVELLVLTADCIAQLKLEFGP